MESLRQTIRGARFRNTLFRREKILRRHKSLTSHDVMIASYPRSGVTWTRFLLYEILKGEDAEFKMVPSVLPYIGKHDQAERSLHGRGRVIFSHEPLLTGVERVIYIVRDPRSVVVSEYQWQQRKRVNPGDFNRFVKNFVRGKTNPWGSWDHHVTTWLDSEIASREELRLMKYEKLRNEPELALRDILRFLDLPVEDEVLRRAIANNSLEKMRDKEDRVPPGKTRKDIRFVSTGHVAGWRESLSAEQASLIEQSFRANMLRLNYLP